MPMLGIPALAGVGGTGAATGTVVTGGTILGGVTATQVAIAGVAVVSAVGLKVLVDDYLDSPVAASEADGILAAAGAPSKEARRRVTDCAACLWCQINIQAQGTFLPLRNRSDPQGIGPYFVLGRTVTAREGVIIAGLTHTFAQGLASSRNFRQIESWDVLGRTIKWIQEKPPGGIGNGEHRVGSPGNQARSVRYDINVVCTINAFMVP
jgi:hypothetical protein